jgi:hypothetical protein
VKLLLSYSMQPSRSTTNPPLAPRTYCTPCAYRATRSEAPAPPTRRASAPIMHRNAPDWARLGSGGCPGLLWPGRFPHVAVCHLFERASRGWSPDRRRLSQLLKMSANPRASKTMMSMSVLEDSGAWTGVVTPHRVARPPFRTGSDILNGPTRCSSPETLPPAPSADAQTTQ